MPDPFITKLNERHLCSWYILPLLGLNVERFGLSNFINAYQITQSFFITIQVIDMHLCLEVCKNPFYKKAVHKDDTDYLIFFVPNNWRPDYKLFLRGRYTKMSEEAKQKIRELSGLKYEVPDQHGNKLTDALLMALENHYVLRRKWAEVLGMYENDLPDELMSTPSSSSFITLKSITMSDRTQQLSPIEQVAKVCHQANKAWCELNGDFSQKDWHEAEDWQKKSAINGVLFKMSNPSASVDVMHNNWMALKESEGWVYGDVKDTVAKTHPCMVPFEELPEFQQKKDALFSAIVLALNPKIEIPKVADKTVDLSDEDEVDDED